MPSIRAFDMNPRKFLMFGVVGAAATPAHYLTLILLVEIGDTGPVFGTSAGSVVGALANYLLNRRYTFESSKAHLDTAPKFFSVALATGLLNALLVYLGADLMGVQYLLVQVGATGIVFFASFALNSAWTFRQDKTSNDHRRSPDSTHL
jgi:putative flippase GtrA